jgi:hypothetical protein
MLESAA